MKAFFFDIFGTLVDWRSSLIKGAQKMNIFENSSIILEELVINWRKEYQPILDKVNKGVIEWKTLDELHEMTLRIVFQKMNFSKITKNEIKYLVNLWHKLDPWEDSSEGIDLLNTEFITASLSNGNIKLQKNLFQHAKLKLDFIFSAEHFKKYKPNKIVYLGAINMLNLKPEQCALVASHKSDLSAASEIGMKTVFINRKDEYGNFKNKFIEKDFKSDLEINYLNELPKKIKSINY